VSSAPGAWRSAGGRPRATRILFEKKGEAAWQAGKPDRAVEHLTAALKTDPKMLEARFLRGCAHCREEDYLAAYQDLAPIVEKLPDGRGAAAMAHVAPHTERGLLLAAAYYRRAVDKGYRTALVYNNLAYCAAQTGSLDEAAKVLKIARALDPELRSARLLQVRVAAQITAWRRQITDMSTVEEVVEAGPSTAELSMDAAIYYLFCAKASDDPRLQQDVTDRMYELLAHGLDQGLPKSELKIFLDVDPQLKENPRWQAIESRPESNAPFVRLEIMHDFLDELTRPQTAALSAGAESSSQPRGPASRAGL